MNPSVDCQQEWSRGEKKHDLVIFEMKSENKQRQIIFKDAIMLMVNLKLCMENCFEKYTHPGGQPHIRVNTVSTNWIWGY